MRSFGFLISSFSYFINRIPVKRTVNKTIENTDKTELKKSVPCEMESIETERSVENDIETIS